MSQRKIIKAKDLAGINIYQDPKRGTVYYDWFTKKGYILTSSDVKTYTIYTSMMPLCILVAFAASSLFSLSYVVAIILCIALYAAVAVLFRIKFFYKLPEATNWHPVKKENIFISTARNLSIVRLVIIIVLLTALTIMMPIYASIEGMSGFNLFGTYLVTAATVVGLIIIIVSLILKIKNNY